MKMALGPQTIFYFISSSITQVSPASTQLGSNLGPFCCLAPAMLERFWRISLYLSDDAIAKLYVT